MSNLFEDIDENFPDWTDETLGIDGMVENMLKAEEKHATAKENIFHEIIRISKETLEAGPDFLKKAPFYPGLDLFTFRGMPLDAILAEGYFDAFEADANDGADVFYVRVFIDLQENAEDIGMFGVLVWADRNDIEHAWLDGEWTDRWKTHSDGVHNCYTCQHQMECVDIIGEHIKETEFYRMQELDEKINEKFPKLKKYLSKHDAQMVLMPTENAPALQVYEEIMNRMEAGDDDM